MPSHQAQEPVNHLLTQPAGWQPRQREQHILRGTVLETENEGRDLENWDLTNWPSHLPQWDIVRPGLHETIDFDRT